MIVKGLFSLFFLFYGNMKDFIYFAGSINKNKHSQRMPSICQGTWDCQICPKAVSNAITHVIYQRGFHKPAQKCEENLILF